MEFGKEINVTEDGSVWCKAVGITTDQVITGDRGYIFKFTAIGHYAPGEGSRYTPDYHNMTWCESRAFIISGATEDEAIENFVAGLTDPDSYVNTHWTFEVIGLDLRPVGSHPMILEDNVGA